MSKFNSEFWTSSSSVFFSPLLSILWFHLSRIGQWTYIIRQRLAIKKALPAQDVNETLPFDATQAAEAHESKSLPEVYMSSPPSDKISRSLAADFASAAIHDEGCSADLTLNHILAVFSGVLFKGHWS